MKRMVFSGITNIKKTKAECLRVILSNKLISFLVLILLFGMIVGTISAKFANENIINNLDFLFSTNFKSRSEQNLFDTFAASFTSSFVFVLVLILLGLSVWGIIFIPFISFFRGFGLGLIAGFLYSSYGFKGVLFHILVLLPGIFISSIGIILESKESLKISSKIISVIKPNGNINNQWQNIRLYLIKSGYVFIILSIAATTDMALNSIFANMFSF